MGFNFSNTTPSAPTGSLNISWQKDGSGNISANIDATWAVSATIQNPINSQLVLLSQLPVPVTFPSGASASSAIALTAATGSTVYTFYKNGSSFATATFGASDTTASWTQASSESFNGSSDVLKITGPSTADATLASIGITFVGIKT